MRQWYNRIMNTSLFYPIEIVYRQHACSPKRVIVRTHAGYEAALNRILSISAEVLTMRPAA